MRRTSHIDLIRSSVEENGQLFCCFSKIEFHTYSRVCYTPALISFNDGSNLKETLHIDIIKGVSCIVIILESSMSEEIDVPTHVGVHNHASIVLKSL